MKKKTNRFNSALLTGALFLSSCQNLPTGASAHRTIANDQAEQIMLEKGIFPEEKVLSNIIDSEGKAKIVFNLPPYVNPGRAGIVPEMLKTINEAKVSLRLSIFQFNHKETFAALEKAAQRGVKIFVTTDLCYSGKTGYKEYFDSLKKVLADVGQNADTQIIDDKTPSCDTMFNHNKYMIVDWEKPEIAKAWFGSYNPTNHGSVENVELAIIAQDKRMADLLMLDFDQQIKGTFKVNKKGVYTISKGGSSQLAALSELEINEKTKEGYAITYPTVTLGDMEFQFILSPKVKSLTRIVEEVYSAKKEILFSSFAIADQMLISSLINKSDSTEGNNNLFSILALPHPGEGEGVVFLKNGDPANKEVLFDKKTSKTKDAATTAKLTTIAKEINEKVATPVNYLTPKNEVKSVYRYFYPRGSEGGVINKVHVEGIFNSKVINEETTLKRLADAGVSISKSTLTGELHNKLFIIDEDRIIFGSHNFSQSAENGNDELTVIIKGQKLARLLKNELFIKTKLFSFRKNGKESFSGKAPLIITEIMSESLTRYQKEKRVIDAGDYVEVHNLGDKGINLLGMRMDDHFFPDHDGDVYTLSTNPGFIGTLVRFTPAEKAGDLGTTNFKVSDNVLPAGKTALIVGKYFHPDHYLENFKKAFQNKYKKEAAESDYPVLYTFAEYYSSVLGDSTTGLTSKDKVTLYGVDATTVIDRFSFPKVQLKPGQSLQRQFDSFELRAKLENRDYSFEEKKYTLKNGAPLTDAAYLPTTGFSEETDWKLSAEPTPGVVDGSGRGIASEKEDYTIEGMIADVNTNTWIQGTVLIKKGKISEIIKGTTSSQKPLMSDVLIFPGFIDTHNHIKYNTMPVWLSPKSYLNRDQWPNENVYKAGVKELYKNVYGDWSQCEGMNEADSIKCFAMNRCKIIKYAELKALAGATTSLQGSSSYDETSSDLTFRGLTPYTVGDKKIKSKAREQEDLLDQCTAGGARNIERELWHGSDEVRTTAQSVTSDAWVKKKVGDAKTFPSTPSGKLLGEFASGQTKTFFIHLGEGIDAPSLSEWKDLTDLKLNVAQTTIIHGTALGEPEFKLMAQKGQSIAWSPTSNLLLYKKTTDVLAALKNKVNVSIGSDWSLSGTKSLLYELKVANMVNEKKLGGKIPADELLRMVTINGAKASHLEDLVGSIEKGKLADFFVISKKLALKTPLETLLQAQDSSIEAVFVGGSPVFGKEAVMKDLSVELNLDAPKSIKDSSCKHNVAVLLPESHPQGMIDELAAKTQKGYSALKPKIQEALGSAFSRLDPLCSEGDERMMSIINSL
jgi:5-methylthioadenosine/S-adenosylhomocysteine deaminase